MKRIILCLFIIFFAITFVSQEIGLEKRESIGFETGQVIGKHTEKQKFSQEVHSYVLEVNINGKKHGICTSKENYENTLDNQQVTIEKFKEVGPFTTRFFYENSLFDYKLHL